MMAESLDTQNTIQAVTAGDLLTAARADANVTRQGVMNHQTAAHFMDMSFTRDAFEMSIPEAAAISNLNQGQLAGLVAGLNTGHSTPSSAGSAQTAKTT
jgi:hypothetical protein